jgi:hypothetical protein
MRAVIRNMELNEANLLRIPNRKGRLQHKDQHERDERRLAVGKRRNGQSGVLRLYFTFPCC